MSIRTKISTIRRKIESRKIRPREAYNATMEILDCILDPEEEDSVSIIMSKLWSSFSSISNCADIQYDSYSHGSQQALSANIQIIGDLIEKLEKKLKEEK